MGKVTKYADQFLLLLAAIVMAISIYQLYFRPYERGHGQKPEVLAHLLKPTETVKFKEDQSFSWKDAREGLKLSDGDRIYTHKSSLADLKFLEGPQISLAPNTLLQIRKSEGNLGLALDSGSFESTFNSQTDYITLILGKRKFVLSSKESKAKVKIVKSKTSAEITVLSGRVKLKEVKNILPQTTQTKTQAQRTPVETTAPEDQEIELNVGQSITRKAMAEEITKDELPRPSLEAPVPLQELLALPNQNSTNLSAIIYENQAELPLQWKRPEDAKETTAYEVEWEKDGVLSRETIQQESFNLKLKTDRDGVHPFKWRIRQKQVESVSAWSKWQEVTFNKKPPLQHFPETGSEIVLEKPNQEVTFRWQKSQQEKAGLTYLFEVAKDNRFSQDLLEKKLKKNEINIPLGAAGTYYWRVRVVDKKGNVRFGTPVEIKIRPAPPPPPVKLKKNLKFKLKTQSLLKMRANPVGLLVTLLKAFIPESRAQRRDDTISLTWPIERLAKSYVVRIYRGDSTTPILEKEVKKNSFQWNGAKAGRYTWEVLIRDYWDRLGEPSNRSNITIEKLAVKKKIKTPKKIGAPKKVAEAQKPKKPKKPKKKATKVNKEIQVKEYQPPSSFHLGQFITQSTVESSAATFLAEASGPFVYGVILSGEKPLFSKKWSTRYSLSLGTGKAYSSLSYFQGQAYFLVDFLKRFTASWTLSFGPSAIYQTSFDEKVRGTLSEDQNTLLGGQFTLQRNFLFFEKENNVEISAAFGQMTWWQVQWRSVLTKIGDLPLSLGLRYESLSFETTTTRTQETTRNSLGLLWQLTWP